MGSILCQAQGHSVLHNSDHLFLTSTVVTYTSVLQLAPICAAMGMLVRSIAILKITQSQHTNVQQTSGLKLFQGSVVSKMC